MFISSHKHKHLKGLVGQRGPLCHQHVLALAEGACVIVTAATLSSSLMQASTCNSIAS
jgi:hypothetical protein